MRRFAAFLSCLLVIGALAGAFVGCQQLFTTSLGKALARDRVSLPSNLDGDDAARLAQEAKDNNDIELAEALVENLVEEIGDPPDSGALKEYGASAASAAITASGLGSALVEYMGESLDGTPDLDAILAEVQASATTDIVTALTYLDPATGIPTSSATASGLSATDYVIAAAVIASSLIPPGTTDIQNYVFPASPEYTIAQNLVAAAQGMTTDSNSRALLDNIAAAFSL